MTCKRWIQKYTRVGEQKWLLSKSTKILYSLLRLLTHIKLQTLESAVLYAYRRAVRQKTFPLKAESLLTNPPTPLFLGGMGWKNLKRGK
jgi:hypothetical protein